MQPRSRQATAWFPTVILALLITSYYYVLPLGRYAVAGIGTDYRLYDFMFLVFLALTGLSYLPELRRLSRDRSLFFSSIVPLLWLVWMSLFLTLFLGGSSRLMAAVIRAFRFSSYLVASGFVVVIVKDSRQYRFMLWVIYGNIAVQALLAFAQALDWLPGFWPDYWLAAYGEWPVGTLSPHHKHIGVVMLLGVALTLVFVRTARSLFIRLLLIVLMGIMVAVIGFVASRTAMLGLAALLLADIHVHKVRSVGYLLLIFLGLYLLWMFSSDTVKESLEYNLETAVTGRIERFGIAGVAQERTNIYTGSIPETIRSYPWALLTGTGFQNVATYLQGATAAHNNYAQVLLELGIVGLVIYTRMLLKILKNLRSVGSLRTLDQLEREGALGTWAGFVAVMATMLVGESLWAQYSMFTLTGQIMTLVALAVSPMLWSDPGQE